MLINSLGNYYKGAVWQFLWFDAHTPCNLQHRLYNKYMIVTYERPPTEIHHNPNIYYLPPMKLWEHTVFICQTWNPKLKPTHTSGGHHLRPVQTFSLKATPLVLLSGGHKSMYSWQATGTHPIGMLSCLIISLKLWELIVQIHSKLLV